MVTIGNDTLPGTITTIESAPSVGRSVGSPGTAVLLGQADLSNGNASANSAERVTRSKKAVDLFGSADVSQLTTAIQDALVEGADPVYAIAPPVNSVTGEDLSGNNSQNYTLSNAPIMQNPDDVTFTINSTTKTTVFYLDGDVHSSTPGTDEVYVNPINGKARADESMGNSGDDVDYEWLDWSNTFDEIDNYQINSETYLRDIVDFVVPLCEKDSISNSAETQVNNMESNGDFAIALLGAGDPYIADTGNYTNNFDNSRVQLVYPSRDGNKDTVLGGYAGRRSEIGIDTSPIFNRVNTAKDLQFNLSVTQQEELVNSFVVPLDERSGGARIIEDLTTVSDSNSSESAWTQGSARLITDFVAETVRAQAEPFVGEFNNTGVLNTMRGNISSELKALLNSNALDAYSLVVSEVDSTTVAVDVGISTADPLRNIELTVSAGNVQGGVQVSGG